MPGANKLHCKLLRLDYFELIKRAWLLHQYSTKLAFLICHGLLELLAGAVQGLPAF
jgi:hypothetical protein